MSIEKIRNLSRTRGLENAILTSILLFLFNLVFPLHNTFLLSLVNEVLVFATLFFLYSYVHPSLNSKTDSPLAIVLNAGILGALVFFIIAVADSFGGLNGGVGNLSVFNSLLAIVIVFVFIGVVVYIFASFRVLFFLRQKKDVSTYFNTMLFFFALAFFSNLLIKIDAELDYAHSSFYVVSIVLISLNSLRISWIAFLVKRQKLYLLLISVVLSVLFGVNFGLLSETNTVRQFLAAFSPGLYTLLSLLMIYGMIFFGVLFFTTLFHLPTAEAFDRKAEEVTSLMDITKLITQVFDFKELADTITNITTKVCNTSSAWLVTKSESGYELGSIKNVSYIEADKLTKLLINTEDVEHGQVRTFYFDAISTEIKKGMSNFKSVAVAPLKVHEEINGFLFAARERDVNFDEDEKKALQAFADNAAVALENAKLISESIEKERLEKELDVARDIQKKILPSKLPESENLKVSSLFIPAFEVGGDYYDFFEIDAERTGFVVADVSGKGISAAFIMAEVKGIFGALAKLIQNSRELLIKANDILKSSLEKKNFVTAVYGIVDKKRGVLSFSRAGHTPVIKCSDEGVERLQPSGIGLGLDFSAGFANTLKEVQIELKNGDIIAFYSDGIPESKDANYVDYGYDRLEQILFDNRHKNLDEISNILIKDLTLFSKDHSQHDDITLVLIKWIKID